MGQGNSLMDVLIKPHGHAQCQWPSLGLDAPNIMTFAMVYKPLRTLILRAT